MLVDEWQRQLAPFNLWSYLNYQLAIFTLTAGPIQRYNDFQRAWQGMDLGPTDTRDAILLWCRILVGLIKIRVVGGWGEMTSLRGTNDLTGVLIAFYGYPLYLYLNFSGYTDVMIGIGGLLGFKVPENFNHPYLARNVLDFWDRWHISFTHWIRDYVFMSSYKAAATKFPRAARYWGYGLLFVALFLAGVWHGTTNGFVAFGILNGAGAAATRAYGDGLRRMFGVKGLHAYLQNRFIRWVAILVTLHYTCLSMLFFSRNYERALSVLATGYREMLKLPASYGSHVWGPEGAGLLAIAALVLAGLWNSDAIGARIARVAGGVAARRGVLCLSLCTVTAVVVSMLFFDWAFQQVPPPVRYMAF